MWRYLAKRLALALPTFLGVTLVAFAVLHLAPGDAATGRAGMEAGSDSVQRVLRERFSLDAPLHVRYGRWLADVVRLDLGRSFADGRQVRSVVWERLPPTFLLMASAMVVSLLISIPVSLVCAQRENGLLDRFVGGACFGLYAVPRYVMALVLIVVVGVRLEWFPFMGMSSDEASQMSFVQRLGDTIRHSVLICACLVYPLAAQQIRFLRASLVEVYAQDFIRTARAKGASELRVALRHALPCAIVPLVTLLGLMLPSLIGGTVILEVIFSWPGMGRLMFEAVMQRDQPVVMAVCTLSAMVVLLGTMVVDVVCGWVDPRIRQA